MEVPTEDQLTAEFIRAFREMSGGGDDSAVPVGDAEVVLQGMVDLPLLVMPLAAAVWAAAYRQGREDGARGDAAAAERENPYGEPGPLPSDDEARALLEPEEGPGDV